MLFLRHYAWRGEKVAVSDLCRLRLKACSRCLADDAGTSPGQIGPTPHGRSTWLIRHIRTYPNHHVRLVDLPSPYSSMDDFAGTISLLPNLLAPDYPVVERASSEFEGHLLTRLDGHPDPDTPWVNELPALRSQQRARRWVPSTPFCAGRTSPGSPGQLCALRAISVPTAAPWSCRHLGGAHGRRCRRRG